jgi:6-phospho-3-hexuloisomerase
MTTSDLLTTVRGEISGVLDTVSQQEIGDLAERLATAQRVFVTGEGRSGFMAKAFAMRLMHLGLTVYVTGETITPSVGAGDSVVAVSGSGTTKGTVRTAEQARSVGAFVYVVTTAPDSPLAQIADLVLTVPAATKHRRAGEAATVQPLSSLFDQATHIVLDVVCLQLAESRGVDNAGARRAHSNTE